MTATTQFITFFFFFPLNEMLEFFLIKCTCGQERVVDTSVLRVTECCFQVRLVTGDLGSSLQQVSKKLSLLNI